MQKNFKSLKRKVFIDGKEYQGLVKVSAIKDEEGTNEIASFGRLYTIKNGVKKFEPISITYNVLSGTNVKQLLSNWFVNSEYHDLEIVNVDATGQEFDRWKLRDCECASHEEEEYDAGGVKAFAITAKILCTTEPTRVDAQ